MERTRRSFLRTALEGAAAVGGAVLGAGNLLAADEKAEKPAAPAGQAAGSPAGGPRHLERKLPPRFKLSLAAYSYRQYLENEKGMTLEAFIDECARLGLDGTELTGYYFRSTDPEYLASLKRRAFLLGLDISGTAVGNDFCRAPGPERDKDLAHVKAWIEHAARLGAPSIRIFAGSVPRGGKEEEARARAVEACRECARDAARHGVLLALENHGGITATAEGLLSIVRAVDSPWVGVNLDTGNFHTEDPYRDLEEAAPWAVTVQVKVEVQARGKAKTDADLGRVMDILRRTNYRGYVALEYEAAEDPRTAVPRHVEKLKSLLAASP